MCHREKIPAWRGKQKDRSWLDCRSLISPRQKEMKLKKNPIDFEKCITCYRKYKSGHFMFTVGFQLGRYNMRAFNELWWILAKKYLKDTIKLLCDMVVYWLISTDLWQLDLMALFKWSILSKRELSVSEMDGEWWGKAVNGESGMGLWEKTEGRRRNIEDWKSERAGISSAVSCRKRSS